MVGTPYVLLAAFGFMIYRGFKKINQAEAARSPGQDVEPFETGSDIPADPR
jgi:hypothetical protein